jgi:hypothetical protein
VVVAGIRDGAEPEQAPIAYRDEYRRGLIAGKRLPPRSRVALRPATVEQRAGDQVAIRRPPGAQLNSGECRAVIENGAADGERGVL